MCVHVRAHTHNSTRIPTPHVHAHTRCLFKILSESLRRRRRKKKTTNVYPSSGCHEGLLGCDTCHNHQTFLVPSGLRVAAKVKLLKGKEGGREEEKWLTTEGQKESYLSSSSCKTLVDAEAAYACWESCRSSSV